jgi:hypothetical protein
MDRRIHNRSRFLIDIVLELQNEKNIYTPDGFLHKTQ